MYPGFVLVKYGKVTDLEITALERRIDYLISSLEKGTRHCTPGRIGKHLRWLGDRSEGRAWVKRLYYYSGGKF